MCLALASFLGRFDALGTTIRDEHSSRTVIGLKSARANCIVPYRKSVSMLALAYFPPNAKFNPTDSSVLSCLKLEWVRLMLWSN